MGTQGTLMCVRMKKEVGLSHRRATVAQSAKKAHASYDRKVPEHTVHALCRCRHGRVFMLIPLTTETNYNVHLSMRPGPWSSRKDGLVSLITILYHVAGHQLYVCVRVSYLRKETAPWRTMGRKQTIEGKSVLIWATFCWKTIGSCYSCRCYLDMYHLPKHCCRPSTPLLLQQQSLMPGVALTSKLPRSQSEHKWSANPLVQDFTGIL